MALKIRTVMTYPLNGSTVDFMITFEYLARKFVTVTLVGKDRKELVLNQDYRFSEKNRITTTRAWGGADGYTLIEVRRYTSATDRLVDFADGSILRAYDLNISQVQTLHVAEEARDLTADTIGVNNDGDLDARGRKIVNLADPTGDYDAVNLRTIKQWNDGTYQSYIKAQAEAVKAAASADRSQSEADRAKREADRAAASQSAAAGSATAAARSEGNAKSSENNASSSAAKALVSENNAKSSENNAWSSFKQAEAEANRSTTEADRAKREADKLGNMNQLSEAIESVNPPVTGQFGKVVWKYDMDVKTALRAYSGMSLGWGWDGKGTAPFLNFYRGKDDALGSIILDAGKVVRFNGMNSVNFDSTINGKSITGSWIRSTGDIVVDETLYVHGGNYIVKDKWVQSGANKQTNMIRANVGGFSVDEYFAEIVGQYIERGWHLGGGDNDTWLQHRGNGTLSLNSPNGSRIVLNNGTTLENDGNLRGAIWDNKWLRDFMEDRYLVNIWIGSGRTRHVGQQTWEGWIDNGCVMRGIKQIRAGSDCFIEELYFNELWKATARGQWIV